MTWLESVTAAEHEQRVDAWKDVLPRTSDAGLSDTMEWRHGDESDSDEGKE
jgi:hypothetical protein